MKNVLFAALGLLLVLIAVYLIRMESQREWKNYQREFYREVVPEVRKPERASEERFEPELKQHYLPELGRTDRCVTCHLGIEDPAFSAVVQPYKSHSAPYLTYHQPDKFGCAVCHRGQGLATKTGAAHGFVRHWDEPMTPLQYMEGSCGKCHRGGEIRGAPFFNSGRRLFLDWACLSCHKAKGYELAEKVGPDLGQIKIKLKDGWIERFLKDPKSAQLEPSMPDFKLVPEEVRALVDFLQGKASNQPVGGEPEAQLRARLEAKSQEEIKQGEKVFHDSGCSTCHILEGHELEGFRKVKPIGPNLSRLYEKVKADWLARFLKDPKFFSPKVRMPTFNLKTEEVENLAAFLFSESRPRPGQAAPGADHAAVETAPSAGATLNGEEVFKKYNCVGCHDLEGFKDGEPGPELDGLADKPVRKLDFGDVPVSRERSLESWLWAKVMTPRTFRETLKMPSYYFQKEEIDNLINFLLSFSKEDTPEKYRVAERDPSMIPLQMPRDIADLFEKYRCLSCHSIRGDGGETAPDLTGEGSRVKRAWLVNYLKGPTTLRPLLAARMPKLGLSDAEAERLADSIEMSLVAANVQHGFIREKEATEDVKIQGYRLFSRKYPCLGCHKVGDKGGGVGPDLSRAGDRLRGDWIYTWIKDPASIDPAAPMPKIGLSDEEAKAIALYLSSLK